MHSLIRSCRALAAAILFALGAMPITAQAQELTMWSHWAAEVAKRASECESCRGEDGAARERQRNFLEDAPLRCAERASGALVGMVYAFKRGPRALHEQRQRMEHGRDDRGLDGDGG